MSKVTTLTAEQWAWVRSERDRIISEARANGPADRERVERGVVECYALLGHKAPRVIWLDGPHAVVGVVGAAQLGGQLWDQLWDQLRGQLRGQLGGQLDFDAWWTNWAHHWLTVDRLVPAPVQDDLRHRVLSWIDMHSAGLVAPFKKVCFLSEKHTALTVDAQGRLHSSSESPAWEWADGTRIYAHHGRPVDRWVLNPTVEQIAAEPNIEVRRCAIERMGWAEYIAAAGWRPIASDRFGDLFEVADDPGQQVVLVTNGTPERDGTVRRYGLLCVGHNTPLEAVAASYGVPPAAYAAIERRT